LCGLSNSYYIRMEFYKEKTKEILLKVGFYLGITTLAIITLPVFAFMAVVFGIMVFLDCYLQDRCKTKG